MTGRTTKVEALKELMGRNGGIASWNFIYDNIEKFYPAAKSSEQWKAGLRGVLYREIRNNKHFKRIGLGVYALLEYEEEKIENIEKDKVRMHSYIEGLLVELGNYEKFDTYCADPTALFQPNVPIAQLTTVQEFPEFTYRDIGKIAKRIDVIWFSKKENYKFPKRAIEVVDSIGTLENSLSRIYQLNEFQSEFWIVSPENYTDRINKALKRDPYSNLPKRFKVKNYKEVVKYHANMLERETVKF